MSANKNVSPDRLGRQIWKALLKNWLWTLLTVLAVLAVVLLKPYMSGNWYKVLQIVALTLFVADMIAVCNNLTDVNSLLRKEHRITWCQIWILIAIGIWIVGAILIIDIQTNPRFSTAFGVGGSVLAWIFQDKIKGAVAFIHLRKHHMLNLGDWIDVPACGVNGVVKKVTLTNVTIYNWDTTTSTIPINTLQAGHFINLQNMSDGKTYGRQMEDSFILDTECIYPMTAKDVELLKSSGHDIESFLPEGEIKEGVLNAHLFRLYIYHWLMQDPHVSQKPRLLVRWMDQTTEGMELNIHAFLTDCGWSEFESQKSRLFEHIMTSMGWFGLRLYQRPSASSFSNFVK